jgi:2-dehydro-3-deoxygluconokinase
MALAAAERHQCCVVFDPNVRRKLASPTRAASVLRPMAARAHIVLAGLGEAQLLSGRDDRDAAAGWFLDRAAHLVVLKDGAAGAWATDGTTTWTQPAYPVPVVDPVGAGDAFNSGLLAALLRGADVDVAMHEAAAVAALVVTTAGDIEGLPRSEAELTRFRAAEAVQR